MKEILYRNLQKNNKEDIEIFLKSNRKQEEKIVSYETKLPSDCFSILEEWQNSSLGEKLLFI